MKYGRKAKGGKDDDDYESSLEKKMKEDAEEEKAKLNPKQELIAGLEKCCVIDPVGLATTLFNGNQVLRKRI
jgi:hypothetical protein